MMPVLLAILIALTAACATLASATDGASPDPPGHDSPVLAPPVRVALMDFSTDDNSYRSVQAAANFTALLQIELGATPGIEWVERTQLELAKKELALSDLEMAAGSS